MEALKQLADSPFPLLIGSLLALVCCVGSNGSEASEASRGGSFGASFRSLAATVLPPAVFFLFGQTIADYPLANSPSSHSQVSTTTILVLGAALHARIVQGRVRIQPFLISLFALSGFVLPLGLALERFIAFLHGPFRDDGQLGMISVSSALFALSLRFVAKSVPNPPGDERPLHHQLHGQSFLMLAWIFASISRSGFSSTSLMVLLIASGTSLLAITTASLARTGTIAPRGAMIGPLSGIFAAMPVVTSLAPSWGALAGFIGAFAGVACNAFLGRMGIDDDNGAISAPLGGGLAGLVVAGLHHPPGTPLSFSGITFQIGIVLVIGAYSFLFGYLMWRLLALPFRLAPSRDELDEGLDFIEHGIARRA